MNKKAIRDLLVIILILAAFPIVLKGGGKIFGLVLAAMILVASVVMLPFCLTLGLLFAGGIKVFLGISQGILSVVSGLANLVIGVLAGILSFKFYKKAIPWVIRKMSKGSGKKQEINIENSEESVH